MDRNSHQNAPEQKPNSPRDSKRDEKDLDAGQSTEPGLLGRVAESAARLAGSVARSGAQGASAFDPHMLAEAKSGQQAEGSSTMSQQWMAESSTRLGKSTTGTPDISEGLASIKPESAAASFRHAARAVPEPAGMAHPASRALPESSHQVSLAENLDGRGVTDFLAHTMPTSMSIGDISGPASGPRVPARQHGPHRADTVETTDPIAYLQGTSYAADMEPSDHRVPQGSREDPAAHMPHASPIGLSRSWDEHGASVLEEWELNEAWDRAWMDTAWTSARKREKAAESTKTEPVLPSKKNLSYLLKPRI
ncbi:hypothetical protein IWW50_001452 [Coemansia erecta]|nr:hypothetical protein IWW50_001452 [Coemansia erecta]